MQTSIMTAGHYLVQLNKSQSYLKNLRDLMAT